MSRITRYCLDAAGVTWSVLDWSALPTSRPTCHHTTALSDAHPSPPHYSHPPSPLQRSTGIHRFRRISCVFSGASTLFRCVWTTPHVAPERPWGPHTPVRGLPPHWTDPRRNFVQCAYVTNTLVFSRASRTLRGAT